MVFITPELFGSEPEYTRYGISTSDSQLASGLGKRKRRPGEDEGSTSSNYSFPQRLSPSGRGLRKFHGLGHDYPASDHWTSIRSPFPPAPSCLDCRPLKQLKRLSPKLSLVKSTSHLMDTEPDGSSLSAFEPNVPTHSDLRPCHACKTAPKRRRELENYLECKRCDERTCYICARKCVGGCQKAICKKCAVEVGQEGNPWCLDCYSRSINS